MSVPTFPRCVCRCVDDIVLSYVVGVLEDLGEDEDGFDVEGFTEMLAAYSPEFAEIKPEQVCEWIFGLSTELTKRRKGTCKVVDIYLFRVMLKASNCEH